MASSGNYDLLNKLQGMIDDATDVVRDIHDQWEGYLDFYQGVQGETLGLSSDDLKDWVNINILFAHIETCVPILADAAPLWYVVSPDGEHETEADELTSLLQGVWQTRRVARQYKMALRDQLVLGTGFLKPWWNPLGGKLVGSLDERGRLQRDWQGEVDVSWVDPFSVYPDPTARCLEDCSYLALASDVSAERAVRLWEKFDEEGAQVLEDDTERPANWLSRALAWISNIGSRATRRPYNRQVYRVWEVYHEHGERLTIFTGKQVLWDGDNPTPNQQYPLACFPSYERGYGLFGMPVTAQVKELQTKINKQHLYLQQYQRLVGKVQLKTDDSGAAEQITRAGGRPGTVIQVARPGGYVDVLTPPPMPNWVFAHLQRLYEDFDTLTGVREVTRGMRPGSVQSGIGIQQLQEAANTRLRDLTRDNALQLERLGQIVLDLVQANYDDERTMAYYRGSSLVRTTVKPDMLRGNVEMGPEMMAGMGMGPEMMGAEGGAASFDEDFDFRVVVETGASLPLNAMAQGELAIRAYQMRDENGMPLIDEEAALEGLRYPHRREILQRRQQKMAMLLQGQMAAQQMQMAQQAGGGMGAPGEGPQAMPGQAPPSGVQPSEQVYAALAALKGLLTDEELEVVAGIVQQAQLGQPITPEQEAWLNSLPEEAQAAIAEALQMLGAEGMAGGMMGGGAPQMGLV